MSIGSHSRTALGEGNQQRLSYLDSIRGIAALVVVLSHCWLLEPPIILQTANNGLATALHSLSASFIYTISKLHESGRSAVIIFFVLSGFVLAYSLEKKPMPYFGYLTKRVFRIYPTFLVIVLASFVLHRVIGFRHDVSSSWLETVVNPDTTFHSLLKSLVMAGTTGTTKLDGPIWSLFHEMRISLIFPLILLMLKRFRAASMLAFFLVSVAATLRMLDISGSVIGGFSEETFLRSLLDTAFFVVFFAAGALLAITHKEVALRVANAPRWTQVILCLAAGYCLLKTDYNSHSFAGCLDDYIRGVGALGLIALALGIKKISSGLSHGFLVWLGRISYSLYLVHIPILYVVNQTIGASWSVLETSIAFIPLSILAAEVMARLIEFPSIELGKKLCGRGKATAPLGAVSAPRQDPR
jgi:peptidoglycan/LPS O-acetylase OafA/YrhL